MNLMFRTLLVFVACAAVGIGIRIGLRPPLLPDTVRRPVADSPVMRTVAVPESVVALASRTAPFRARRALSTVAYDPAHVGINAVPAPAQPPRPTLTLTGIVWGGDPSALIEGIPGADGPRVMGRGDTLGGIRVRQIHRNDVVVSGLDTTWVLRVREVW